MRFLILEHYKQDIDEVVEFSIQHLNRNHQNKLELVKILNGYKHFDPTRGASYIIDCLLNDNEANVKIHKRVNVMRPLGLVEILPMPYVTEASKITLVVAVSAELDPNNVEAFFKHYEQTVLKDKETAERLSLFIVYLELNNFEKEFFSKLNSKVSSLNRKYSITIAEGFMKLNSSNEYYLSESYRQLSVAEYVSTRLSDDALILLASTCAEMDAEFLNRVRLNTIQNSQVFFPIAFSEFMPNIIYPAAAAHPDKINLNKMTGYYNTYSFQFVSFYNSDYIKSRAKFVLENLNESQLLNNNIDLANHETDLYRIFVANTNLHLMRATDQDFKCRWDLIKNCDKQRTNEEQELCRYQKEQGLGTKAQLAMFLINNHENILLNKSRLK